MPSMRRGGRRIVLPGHRSPNPKGRQSPKCRRGRHDNPGRRLTQPRICRALPPRQDQCAAAGHPETGRETRWLLPSAARAVAVDLRFGPVPCLIVYHSRPGGVVLWQHQQESKTRALPCSFLRAAIRDHPCAGPPAAGFAALHPRFSAAALRAPAPAVAQTPDRGRNRSGTGRRKAGRAARPHVSIDSPLHALLLAIPIQLLMSMAAFERLLTMRGVSNKHCSSGSR
jgi:hypothetical protein